MVKFVWLCVGFVAINTAVVIGLFLPGTPTEPIYFVPFLFGCISLAIGMSLVNDRWVSGFKLSRLWQTLRLLPRLVQIGLVAGLVSVLAYHFTYLASVVSSDLDYKRAYAVNALWFSLVGATLSYGALLRKRLGDGAPPDRKLSGGG